MLNIKNFILISAIFCILIVSGSLGVPLWITLSSGIIFTGIIGLRMRAEHRNRIETIQHRLINLRSEGLFLDNKIRGKEDNTFYSMLLTILSDLERSLFKLVEKNIQLLSLKEIGRNIISSLDEQRLIDSVFDYLMKGVGYKEVAFFIVRKKKKIFQAIINIEKSTRLVRRVINFEPSEFRGSLLNSTLTGKPFLIKDTKLHPLHKLGGEEIFPGSTMESYLFVPLMKSTEQVDCYNSINCLFKKDSERQDFDGPHYLNSRECMSCPDFPLLGGILVTDGYRAASLTNIDQVTLETVGSLVSSNIENWLLYQELRQEEIFREKILEGMIHGVLAVDMSGTITLANRKSRSMSHYSTGQIMSMKISGLMTSGDHKELPVFKVLERNVSVMHRDGYLIRKDGVHIPVRMNVSPLIGDDGEKMGAIILFADMSDIKRMEEEIRQLDRLAALGRFTSAIAHEIRNPLTGIGAGIQYLNRDKTITEEQKENLNFILNEIDRLNRIITDLFKIARPRNLVYQRIKVINLVDRSHRLLEDVLSDRRISFNKNIDDHMPEIEVDPDLITQVLINLIKNGAEAIENTGKIEVSADTYRGEDDNVMVEENKEMVYISVSDDGVGMNEDERKKIFEPFFSNKKDGTGLGLFVTHSIVQQHQGKIVVNSEPQKGTTIKVYLPIKAPGKGEKIEAGSASGG